METSIMAILVPATIWCLAIVTHTPVSMVTRYGLSPNQIWGIKLFSTLSVMLFNVEGVGVNVWASAPPFRRYPLVSIESIISSCPLLFVTSGSVVSSSASVLIFYLRFLGAVIPEVAWLPTAPESRLSLLPLGRWPDPPLCLDTHFPDPERRPGC